MKVKVKMKVNVKVKVKVKVQGAKEYGRYRRSIWMLCLQGVDATGAAYGLCAYGNSGVFYHVIHRHSTTVGTS